MRPRKAPNDLVELAEWLESQQRREGRKRGTGLADRLHDRAVGGERAYRDAALTVRDMISANAPAQAPRGASPQESES